MSDDFPNRQTFRLKNYDYSRNGMYFITICTNNHENMFGEITNGKMALNEIGKIVENEWLITPNIRHEIKLHDFVIMPNHFHAIVEIAVGANGGSPENMQITPEKLQIITEKLQRHDNVQITDNSIPSQISVKQTCIVMASDAIGSSGVMGSSSVMVSGGVDVVSGEPPFAPTGMPPKSLSSLVAGYKSIVTNKINKLHSRKIKISVWQRNYHEHIIRDENSYHKIVDYIQNNPSIWQNDKFFRQS